MTTKTSATQPTLFEQPLTGHVQMIEVSHIRPPDTTKINPSIRKVGILQSVLLKETTGEYRYEVIEGNRRVYSAMHFGLKEVPAQIVQGVSIQQANAARLITNTIRSENPIHEARALLSILHSGVYADVKSMAKDLDLPLNKIKKMLRLANLPKDILQGIEEKTISVATARNLAKLPESYQAKAIAAYREKAAQGESFNATDLKEVRVSRAQDFAGVLESALENVSALTPLLSLDPATVLAQEIVMMAKNRSVELSKLITELSKISASVTAPDLTAGSKTAISAPAISAPAISAPAISAAESSTPVRAKEQVEARKETNKQSVDAETVAVTAKENASDLPDIFADIPGFSAPCAAPQEEEEQLPEIFLQPVPSARLRTTISRK